jgi:hypothetical protein
LFLKNLRSNWVVIIGLELLILACPGLGLGSDFVTSFHVCHPVNVMVIDPISVENRIWDDGNETAFGVMPTVQGFVRCDAGSLWLVIIPKSKGRFVEQPPMKTVQPRAYMGMTWRSMW